MFSQTPLCGTSLYLPHSICLQRKTKWHKQVSKILPETKGGPGIKDKIPRLRWISSPKKNRKAIGGRPYKGNKIMKVTKVVCYLNIFYYDWFVQRYFLPNTCPCTSGEEIVHA